ncbi:YwqJ-related putative deaminase [Nocardia sp. XZ_19_231]|uniref:WXG100-like domain-containing protein n=1 Tax=Nocardia sp. XZ_19_231 TaxID=2769252 RepID=UPI00188ECDB6|nr:YwqJ-related putative deaminase [Nocardia sp. XZ_19_231]
MIELPDELSWLKIVVGMEWPEGDETEMWALAQDWRTAADGLRAILPDIDHAKTASLKAYPSGEGVEEMTKALDSMRNGDQSLGKLAEYFDLVGDSVDQVAMEIEYTKMMFWTSLGLLLAELAAAWLFPPTALMVEAAAIIATRIAVRIIGERATAAIIRWVARAAANTFIKFMARHVAIDATLGTMQEYLVQQWQVDKGTRDKINVDQVIVAAVSSAAGGAAAGPAGDAMGNWLKNNGVTDKWLQSAITGPAAGLVGAGAGLLAATATQFGIDAYRFDLDTAWDNAKKSLTTIDPLMFTAGASNGFMSGVNKVGANTAWQKMAPGMSDRASLADRINPLLGDFGNLGAGAGSGGRSDGQNSPGGRSEGEGGGRARGEGEDELGAGPDSEVRGDDSETRGERRDDTAGQSSRGYGDGSAMRPAGTTDPGAGPGGPGDGERAGSGENPQKTGLGESRADGDSAVAEGGAPARDEGGARPLGASDDANQTAGQSDSPLQRGEDQRAGLPEQGGATRGADDGVAQFGDPAESQNGRLHPSRAESPEIAAGAAAATGAAHAAPMNAGQSPAATNAGQSPAPATHAGQSPTATQGGGEAKPAGTQATPARSGPAPEMRAPATGDAPRADGPRVAEGRAGAPETRGVPPQSSTERPRIGDGSMARPNAEIRAGVGDHRVAGTAAQDGAGVRADRADAVAPILPVVTSDGQATPRTARAGGRSDGPDATRGTADEMRSGRKPDPETVDEPQVRDIFNSYLANGEGIVYRPHSTSIGDDPRTHRVRENLRNEGMHDVIVHGSEDGAPIPGDRSKVHPQQIVDAILLNPDYVRGTPVRLVSCHSGNDNGWAQYIADRIDAPVLAPTKPVGAPRSPDSPVRLAPGGEWRVFPDPDAVAPQVDGDSAAPPARDPVDLNNDADWRHGLDVMGEDGPRVEPTSFLRPDPDLPTMAVPPPPSTDSHLLGVLDPAHTTRENGLITHVDGEPIADFVRRLGLERQADFVQAAKDKVLSKKAQGAVMSVGIDRATGRVYEAANGRVGDVIADADVHPTVAERFNEMRAGTYTRGDDPETFDRPHPDEPLAHAEVKTTNQILHDRARLKQTPEWSHLRDDADALPDIINSPMFVKGVRIFAPCCANCTMLLDGAQSTTGYQHGYPPSDFTPFDHVRRNPDGVIESLVGLDILTPQPDPATIATPEGDATSHPETDGSMAEHRRLTDELERTRAAFADRFARIVGDGPDAESIADSLVRQADTALAEMNARLDALAGQADAALARTLEQLTRVEQELATRLDRPDGLDRGPDRVSPTQRIDAALADQLARDTESAIRRAEQAEAHHQAVLDRIDHIGRDLAAQAEHVRTMRDLDAAQEQSRARFDESAGRDRADDARNRGSDDEIDWLGSRRDDDDGEHVPPAAEESGGANKPPTRPLAPAGFPEPGEGDGNAVPRGEPDEASPVRAGESSVVHVTVDGEQVPVRVEPDGPDNWRLATRPENTPATPEEPPAPVPATGLRGVLNHLRDRLFRRANPDYVAGSGIDGFTPLRDGVAALPQLPGGPHAPMPHGHPPPHSGPEIREVPDSGHPVMGPGVVTTAITFYRGRVHAPVFGRFSSLRPDVAGEYMPVHDDDGTPYEPWFTEGDPAELRTLALDQLDTGRITRDEARDMLRHALARAEGELRRKIIDELDLRGLISIEDADALRRGELPSWAEPPSVPESSLLPVADDSLTGLAARSGFDLPDESPLTVRRVVDEQTYLAWRDAAAVEALAAAARRVELESSIPYASPSDPTPRPALEGGNRQAEIEGPTPPEAETGSLPARLGDHDELGRPVPLGELTVAYNESHLNTFLRELMTAFGSDTAMITAGPVGNGADPLPVFREFGAEPGGDSAQRAFFENSSRRAQLLDEVATWARHFEVDPAALRGPERDSIIADLRAAAQLRAERLGEFIAAAEPVLRITDDAVGTTFGDQVARMPVGEGQPDRLLVIEGALDRDSALAQVLADHPQFGDQLAAGTLKLEFRTARVDAFGIIHLDPAPTPEVRQVRQISDGRELVVTMLRDADGDGSWRAVQAPEPGATLGGPPPLPRTRAELITELVDVAQELGLGHQQLDFRRIDDAVAELRVDNAVRAAMLEGMADFARYARAVDEYASISDAYSQLADRFKLTAATLTALRLGELLADRAQPRDLRRNQYADLAAYVAELRGIDPDRIDAANARLASALGLEPDALQQKGYTANEETRKFDYERDPDEFDWKKLLSEVKKRERRDPTIAQALAAYAAELHGIDPYSDGKTRVRSADPRRLGPLGIFDPMAIHALREVVAAAFPGGDALEFARLLAENAHQAFGADTVPGSRDPRPQPNPDWLRLVGLDLSTLDEKGYYDAYEKSRAAEPDQHAGLSRDELESELNTLRGDVRARAALIDRLVQLSDEFYRPTAEPTPGHAPEADGPHALHPGTPDPTPPTGTAFPPDPTPPAAPAAPTGSTPPAGPALPAGPPPTPTPPPTPGPTATPGLAAPAVPGSSVDPDSPTPHRDPDPAPDNSADLAVDGTPVPARFGDAVDRQLELFTESQREIAAHADADATRRLDRLAEVLDELRDPVVGLDGRPDATALIDAARAREIDRMTAGFEEREARAEAAHRASMDHLQQVADELAAQAEHLRMMREFDAAQQQPSGESPDRARDDGDDPEPDARTPASPDEPPKTPPADNARTPDDDVDWMGGDPEPRPRYGDDNAGQPATWRTSPTDIAASEVRDVLAHSDLGTHAVRSLAAADAAIRFTPETLEADGADHFDGRTMSVVIGTEGRSQVAQGAGVIRAGVLADAVLAGEVEVAPARIAGLDRDAHIDARLRAEAMALGRQAEFHREMSDAGYDVSVAPLRDLIDSNYRQDLEASYLAAFDEAVSAARSADPTIDADRLLDLARTAGVDRLLAGERFDVAGFPHDGRSFRDIAGREWDNARAHTPPPGLSEYVPSTPAHARAVDGLVRAQAATVRELHRIETDWQRVASRLQERMNIRDDELGPSRRETADLLLERIRHVFMPHLTEEVHVLDALTHRHAEVVAARARLIGEITAAVRADLGVPVAPHGDVTGVVYVSDAPVTPTPVEPAPRSRFVEHRMPPQLDGIGERKLRGAFEELAGDPVGRWAAQVLADNAVAIRYSVEPDARIGYDPVTNETILDRNGSRGDQARELVKAAMTVELTRTFADNGIERLRMSRDEYVATMLDRAAEAHGLAWAFTRGGESNPVVPQGDAIARTYAAEYQRASELAKRIGKDMTATPSAVHGAAHRAGVRAVRASIAELAPTVDGRRLADHHGANWDRAHGIPDSDQPSDLAAIARDTPQRRDRLADQFTTEIETLRALRVAGEYIPVGPAERAYATAHDKALRKAERVAERKRDAPAPERVAADAGRAAVRRYIDKAGIDTAQVAMDLVHGGLHEGEPRWGRPQPVDAGADRLRADDLVALDSAVMADPAAADALAVRALNRYLQRHPEAQRLTDYVALASPYAGDAYRRLVIVAPAGEHMRVLNDLAIIHPQYSNVLWDRSHRLSYELPVVGPGGRPSLRDIPAAQAEGPFRAPDRNEAVAHALARYLSLRGEGRIRTGFDEWLKQLGSNGFQDQSVFADSFLHGRRRVQVSMLADDFTAIGHQLHAAEPDRYGPAHPATVAHELHTRQLSMPPLDGHQERTAPRYEARTVELGGRPFTLWLVGDGDGNWRLAPPTTQGHPADVISRVLPDSWVSDADTIEAAVTRILQDGNASLDSLERRGLLGRLTERLRESDQQADPTPALPPGEQSDGVDWMGSDDHTDADDIAQAESDGLPADNGRAGAGASRYQAAVDHELAALDEHHRLLTAEADADLRRTIERMEQTRRALSAPLAAVNDIAGVVPEADVRNRIDAVLDRELARIDAEFDRRAAEAEAAHQELLDHLDRVSTDMTERARIAGDLDVAQGEIGRRFDELAGRYLGTPDAAVRAEDSPDQRFTPDEPDDTDPADGDTPPPGPESTGDADTTDRHGVPSHAVRSRIPHPPHEYEYELSIPLPGDPARWPVPESAIRDHDRGADGTRSGDGQSNTAQPQHDSSSSHGSGSASAQSGHGQSPYGQGVGQPAQSGHPQQPTCPQPQYPHGSSPQVPGYAQQLPAPQYPHGWPQSPNPGYPQGSGYSQGSGYAQNGLPQGPVSRGTGYPSTAQPQGSGPQGSGYFPTEQVPQGGPGSGYQPSLGQPPQYQGGIPGYAQPPTGNGYGAARQGGSLLPAYPPWHTPADSGTAGPRASADQPGAQPSMMPPMTPMSPPQGGGGRGAGRTPERPYHPENPSRSSVFVQPYFGNGGQAQFDPTTGSLFASADGGLALGGFFADLGNVFVVFYRDSGRLGLRVGGQRIELDGPVSVEWAQSQQRQTRLTILVGGTVRCELIYWSLPPEMDLGLMVRDVMADPVRRATIFGG